MSSYCKFVTQTTYVILPLILPSYQIRQKKGGTQVGIEPTTFPVANRHSNEALFCLTPAGLHGIHHQEAYGHAAYFAIRFEPDELAYFF